ncbi:MAG TPA: hypothetical protein VF338_11445 [Leptolinea sp.]
MYDTEMNIEMELPEIQKVTGFVLPVGNGAVGKSSLPAALDMMRDQTVAKKTVNLEFGFVLDRLDVRDQHFQVMQQYLVPPGQKENEGISGGRSFEKVIETYQFLFKQIDVVLLSYKLVEANSFNDLEYWVSQALELSNPSTQFILVGTHLDMDNSREVTPQMIATGSDFVRSCILAKFPVWQGKVPALEVSTINRQNITLLRNAISIGILRSRHILG